MEAPCYNCQDRVLGCHSLCKKYKEFARFRKEQNEKKSKAIRERFDFGDFKGESISRTSGKQRKGSRA